MHDMITHGSNISRLGGTSKLGGASKVSEIAVATGCLNRITSFLQCLTKGLQYLVNMEAQVLTFALPWGGGICKMWCLFCPLTIY